MKRKIMSVSLALMIMASFLLPAVTVGAAGTKYAAPATDAELEEGGSVVSKAGVGAQIINGTLYVWGWNQYGRLGITETKNPNKNNLAEAVDLNRTVTWPTEVSSSVFGNSDVVKVFTDWTSTYVINAKGEIYAAGSNINKTVAPQLSETAVSTFTKITFFDGMKVVDVNASDGYDVVVKVQEDNGTYSWYMWGANAYGECGTGVAGKVSTPAKLNSGLIPGEVIDTIETVNYGTIIKTESGKVYGMGSNMYGMAGNNLGIESDEVATNLTPGIDMVTNILAPNLIEFGGRRILEIQGSSRMAAALDETGCVWVWGSNSGVRMSLGLGEMIDSNLNVDNKITLIGKPMIAFGSGSVNLNTVTLKARKIYGLADTMVVLCDNNTIYAWGYNNGYRIYDGADKEKYLGYPYPTQILSGVCQQETVIGIRSDDCSFTTVTRSGDNYFSGNNLFGGAGDGSDTSVTTGTEPTPQEPSTMPPVKPTTLNKVYMDVVYTDRTSNALTTKSGAAGTPVTAEVNAGQKFTVKVYFEDFAKLDQFTLPIKFTTDRAQVVYKSGSGDEEYKAYTGDENEPLDGSNIINFGTGTGIQSNIRESVWSGGSLSTNDGYPRVNNAKGYVSVKGFTTNNNAPINGKQLMFSVDFIGTSQGEVTFEILDAERNGEFGDPVLANENLGATWQVVRKSTAVSGLDMESYFPFNDDSSKYLPTVDVKVTPLKAINLDFLFEKDGKQYKVADKSTEKKDGDDTQSRTYYTIDKDSADCTFIVKANPDPINATDANIDSWDIQFDSFTGKNPADKQVADYVSVVQTGTKSYTFTMPDNTITTQDGYFVITATKAGKTIDPIYVKVASMVPPKAVSITNKASCPSPFLVNDSTLAPLNIYSQFTFEATVNDEDGTGNTNVTWTLYHCVENDDGTVTETVIANDDKTAPAVIAETATDKDNPLLKTARVEIQRTTPDKSYVKIKVASTAGAAVCDETTFRVELLASGITTDEVLFIGKSTSRQLNLSAVPYDAYKPEYEIVLSGDSPAATSSHGSYISVNANGTISAGNEFYTGEEDVYDEIIIREKKSDAYYSQLTDGNTKTIKTVKVYVLNILPPPDMDVEALNNVGILNDKVIFNADLQEGDKLTIYKEFMNNETVAAQFSSLSAQEIFELKEGYTFEGGLSGTGGTVGYLVERMGENFTQVPVSYTAEPCMLTGYARLEGKLANSAKNADITVEIQGLRDAEGNPIPAKTVQDETGYFEFENYVPVGSYTIKLSHDLYFTRYINVVVTGTSSESDIVVSTVDNPIYLAPGDLGSPKNGLLDPAEFNTYMYSWVGRVGGRGQDLRFSDYNFAEPTAGDNVIGMYDVGLLLRYYNTDKVYRDWTVTQ